MSFVFGDFMLMYTDTLMDYCFYIYIYIYMLHVFLYECFNELLDPLPTDLEVSLISTEVLNSNCCPVL